MPRTHGRFLAAFAATLSSLALIPTAASAATFVVSSTADAGAGSLRQAILDANDADGSDGIAFAIGLGGAQTITLASPLPAITEPVVIDGNSQDATVDQPVTIAGGDNAGVAVADAGGTDALSGTQLLGFRLTGFTGAALTVTGSYALIQDSVVDDNTGDGVMFGTAGLGAVGGASGHGNRISGNGGDGVDVKADAGAVSVGFNAIGVDAGGAAAEANANGVVVQAAGAQVFGNVIAGNTTTGVVLGACAVFTGNTVGLGTGGAAIANGTGVDVTADGCLVGGSGAGNGNTIAGNTGTGLVVGGDEAIVQGNTIGTATVGNGGVGVSVSAASDTLVGGPGAAANTIRSNVGDGVLLTDSPDAAVHGNTIRGNGGAGVHTVGATTTSETLGNAISGNGGLGILDAPNTPPAVSAVATGGGKLRVRGTFTAAASGGYTLEVFANATCDGSGFGEGETPLGTKLLLSSAAGTAQFDTELDAVVATGTGVTVTVTRQRTGVPTPPGVTSRFSNCFTIPATTTTALTASARSVDEGIGNATVTVIRTGDIADGSTVQYATGNGSATAGADYTATNGTLTFLAGESEKTIDVPIADDGTLEAAETFTLTLSSPSAGVLGAPATITVTIFASDLAGLAVTNPADTDDGTCDDDCTLREAIDDANAAGDRDAITFAQGLGTIHLLSDLPAISHPVLFVGPASISANSPNAVLRVLASAGGTGPSDDTELFDGVQIANTGGPALDAGGARVLVQDATLSGTTGIRLHDAATGAIGGAVGHGNTIHATGGTGVAVESSSVINVSHNVVTAGAGGTAIRIAAAGGQLFDNAVTSGAGSAGIALTACPTAVIRNTVGGQGDGIRVAVACQVGGAGAGQGNTFSGNAGAGAVVTAAGVSLWGNTIHGNGDAGVRAAGSAALLRGNSITGNGDLGIDNGEAGPTAGSPIVSSVVRENGGLHIKGQLAVGVAGQYDLEFFSNARCDTSGYGEGATPLGTHSILAAAPGDAAFDFTLAADAPAGSVITSTWTKSGQTSEFSRCATASNPATGPGGGGGGGGGTVLDPQSAITKPVAGRIRARRLKQITGTAEDAARVAIAVVRRKDGKCFALSKSGRFKRRTGANRCRPSRFLRATGTTTWSYKLKKRFKRGKYSIYSRATASDGKREPTLAKVIVKVRPGTGAAGALARVSEITRARV